MRWNAFLLFSGSSRDRDLVNWILMIKRQNCWKKKNVCLHVYWLISIYMATDLTCMCTVLSAPAQVWPLGLQPHQGSERQTARTACILICQQTSRCQMLKSRFPTLFPLETQNILGIRYSIHILYLFILVYRGDWAKLSQSNECFSTWGYFQSISV